LDKITFGTIEIDDKVLPGLQIKLKPGFYSEEKDLIFTWYAVEQTKRSLTIQLVLDTPLLVSSKQLVDFLEVTFNDPLLFFSRKGNIIRKRHRVLSEKMPRLLENGFVSKALVATVLVIDIASKSFFWGSFFINAPL